MALKNLLFSLTVLIMFGCGIRYKPIKMTRQPYFGKEFRIDGYYFSSGVSRDTSKINSVILFYKNGVFKHHNSYNKEISRSIVEKELVAGVNISRSFLEGFGYYIVKENSIIIEYWTYDSHSPIPTSIVEGNIVNEFTLNVDIFERKEKELWYFMPFPIKPDSTTIFDNKLEKMHSLKRDNK